jgi:hypothetical protein
MMLIGETMSKNMSQHHIFQHKSYITNFAWPGAGSILVHGGEMSAIKPPKNGMTELYLNSLFLHHRKHLRVR